MAKPIDSLEELRANSRASLRLCNRVWALAVRGLGETEGTTRCCSGSNLLFWNDPLRQRDTTAAGQITNGLQLSVGPADFESVDLGSRSQAEGQSLLGSGKVRATASDLLSQGQSANRSFHPGADGVAIRRACSGEHDADALLGVVGAVQEDVGGTPVFHYD